MTWRTPSTSSMRLLSGSASYSWGVRTTGSGNSVAGRCGTTAVMGATSIVRPQPYLLLAYGVIRGGLRGVVRLVPGEVAGQGRGRRGTAVRRGARCGPRRAGADTADPAAGQRVLVVAGGRDGGR